VSQITTTHKPPVCLPKQVIETTVPPPQSLKNDPTQQFYRLLERGNCLLLKFLMA